jgi:hypothetical protein
MVFKNVKLFCKIGFILIFLTSCHDERKEDPFEEILGSLPSEYQEVVSNREKYGIQILYSQIDRDQENQPVLRTWSYHADSSVYFYPASTIKLPIALLALEKINRINIPGLKSTSAMITDSAYSGQTKVLYDSSAESLKPSVAHYIKKVFLVSDNDASNRLYEFLGQEYIHEALVSKGFLNSGILHRLSVFLTADENRHTNPVRFYDQDTVVYQQPMQVGSPLFTERKDLLLGKGYMKGDSLVSEPMDFSYKNFMSLEDLHNILIETIFPGVLQGRPLFELSMEDYDLLYKYMSMYPAESDYPYYGDKYPDNYCKFIMYGDNTDPLPDHIRLFNKVGLAYGYVIDVAYVVDLERRIEFFLSAVMDVNLNRIYMDDKYAYDSLAFPFFAELGKAVYNYELNRDRTYHPDLKRFKFDY